MNYHTILLIGRQQTTPILILSYERLLSTIDKRTNNSYITKVTYQKLEPKTNFHANLFKFRYCFLFKLKPIRRNHPH